MDFINEMKICALSGRAGSGGARPVGSLVGCSCGAAEIPPFPGYFLRIKPGRPVDYARAAARKEFCTIFTGRDILWKTALTITK